MATPSITEWDAQGNPVAPKAAPVSEWDEHGNPMQGAGMPPPPMGPLVGESMLNLAKGTGEGLAGSTYGMGKQMVPHSAADWATMALGGPGAMAAKNILPGMVSDIGHAGKFYWDWATGGQPVGTGTDRSNILPTVEGNASRGIGQGFGAFLGGSALEAAKFGGEKAAAVHELNRGVDITGKLVKNVDHGQNLSMGLLALYKNKIVPTVADALQRIGTAKDAAWDALKQQSTAVNGDTDVAATPTIKRMNDYLNGNKDTGAIAHRGVSDAAQDFYKRNVGESGALNIDSLNRLKGEFWKRANAQATPGADANFYLEAYHAINDSLKEHAVNVGAKAIYDKAMAHSKAYFDLKKGVVDDILDNPNPLQAEHLDQYKMLFDKDGAVWKSVRDQLSDPILAKNYGLGDLGDRFARSMNYANELQKGMSNYARGFQGLFKSAADHPLASVAAYELLRKTPWLIRLFGVAKVAKMLNQLEAGEALRAVRGEVTDPMAYHYGFNRGASTEIPPTETPKAPVPTGQPPVPKGPVTPEERATWGKSARNAKPVGADVARSSGTFGTTEEMTRGLAKALGDERPEAKKAFAAREAQKMRKRVAKD